MLHSCGLQSPSPALKEGEYGSVGLHLRHELNTGDTPDFQVLGNCFFFPQAGFAPDDQEREIEKATDRLGK